jgi:hypothetical protein
MATTNRARLGGSGFTVFVWDSKPVAFARQISHTSPTPVGPGPVPIHPLDAPYPIDIITPAASNIGTLLLELYELYNKKVWDDLSNLAGSVDLVDIFIRVAERENPISLVKHVRPPRLGGQAYRPYTEEYHNCVITNVEDGEAIEVGTMEVLKRITVAYTYMTRNGVRSKAFELANRAPTGNR